MRSPLKLRRSDLPQWVLLALVLVCCGMVMYWFLRLAYHDKPISAVSTAPLAAKPQTETPEWILSSTQTNTFSDYKLLGVVANQGDGRAFALIKSSASDRAKVIRLGETVGDLRLVRIDAKSVLISTPQGEQTLRLDISPANASMLAFNTQVVSPQQMMQAQAAAIQNIQNIQNVVPNAVPNIPGIDPRALQLMNANMNATINSNLNSNTNAAPAAVVESNLESGVPLQAIPSAPNELRRRRLGQN